MTVKQQILETIFSQQTKDIVEEIAVMGEDFPGTFSNFENNDISFRAITKIAGYVNIELLTSESVPNSNDQISFMGNMANVEKRIMYFKPIATYNIDNGTVKLSIVNEFFTDKLENLSMKASPFTFEENMLIAAFSKTAVYYAKRNADVSFRANEIDLELFISDQGFVQSFLADNYLFYPDTSSYCNKPIAAYLLNQQSPSINPMTYNASIFNELLAKGLLTFNADLL